MFGIAIVDVGGGGVPYRLQSNFPPIMNEVSHTALVAVRIIIRSIRGEDDIMLFMGKRTSINDVTP